MMNQKDMVYQFFGSLPIVSEEEHDIDARVEDYLDLFDIMNFTTDELAVKDLKKSIDEARRAHNWICNKYVKPLRNYIYQKTGNMKTAEDIVQDVMKKIWEKREEININLELRPYLYKSAFNTFLDHEKHNKTRRNNTKSIDDSDLSWTHDNEDPASILMKEEKKGRIEKVMAALPEHHRQILNLVFFEELSQEEISARMNIPPGSVGPRRKRAIEKFKKLFENEI